MTALTSAWENVAVTHEAGVDGAARSRPGECQAQRAHTSIHLYFGTPWGHLAGAPLTLEAYAVTGAEAR